MLETLILTLFLGRIRFVENQTAEKVTFFSPKHARTEHKDIYLAAEEEGGPVAGETSIHSMPPKSSKFRGVTLFRPTKKWRAQISAAGKTTSLGYVDLLACCTRTCLSNQQSSILGKIITTAARLRQFLLSFFLPSASVTQLSMLFLTHVLCRDHDTEEEAARAFDRAAINKAGAAAATNFPIDDYKHEIDALRQVSVSELVATLRAKARRHGTQTSQYRGVSLLKQTGKWHGQINVGGKQLHLGFFNTEELAARAYDRAAIHKASVEGGVIVTNLDISEYKGEIEKLQRMTRQELLAMIADEKKSAAVVGGAHPPAVVGNPDGTERLQGKEIRGVMSDGSSEDTDTDGGGGDGGGDGGKRSANAFGRRSKSSSSSQLTHHDVRDSEDTAPKVKGSPVAQSYKDRGREGRSMSSREEDGRLHLQTGTIPPIVVCRTAPQEESSKKSSSQMISSDGSHHGMKRTAAEIIQSSSPRAPGKQRRTKQPPRQAPMAA